MASSNRRVKFHLDLNCTNRFRTSTALARQSGISSRTLYQAFSEEGNPKVETLLTLLDTIGVNIRFEAESRKK